MYADAAGSFQAVLEIRPEDAQPRYWLGVTQLSERGIRGRRDQFPPCDRGQAAFPEAEADLGAALAGQRRFVEAYPLLADAIEQGHGNARRHRALAITLIDARRFQDAAKTAGALAGTARGSG